MLDDMLSFRAWYRGLLTLLKVIILGVLPVLLHQALIHMSIAMAFHFRGRFCFSNRVRRFQLLQDDLAILGETAHRSSHLAWLATLSMFFTCLSVRLKHFKLFRQTVFAVRTCLNNFCSLWDFLVILPTLFHHQLVLGCDALIHPCNAR